MAIKKAILIFLVIGVIGFLGFFSVARKGNNSLNSGQETGIVGLGVKTQESGGISFKATPLDFSFENPVEFKIEIDTHSGSLDFDLISISWLEDDKGNEYKPLNWEGQAPGGHHLSGALSFSKLSQQPEILKLIINVSPSPVIFEWEIK